MRNDYKQRMANQNIQQRNRTPHSMFKKGEIYAISSDKVKLIPKEIADQIELTLGTRYMGDFTWLIWLKDKRTMTIKMSFDATKVLNFQISDKPTTTEVKT